MCEIASIQHERDEVVDNVIYYVSSGFVVYVDLKKSAQSNVIRLRIRKKNKVGLLL